MKSPYAALLAVALCASAGGGARAACQIDKLAELPVTMSDLRPTVRAKINGIDVRMLAATGADYSVISPGSAEELRLLTKPAPEGYSMKGLGGYVEMRLTTVKTFTLDTIPLHDIQFIVGGSETGPGLAGMLGRNVLSYADTEFDLADGVIRLMRPTGCSNRPMAYWSAGKSFNTADILPGSEDRVSPIVIEVVVNGVKLRALLDTGSPLSLITAEAARRANVPTDEGAISGAGFASGIGRRTAHTFTGPLDSIKIGDEEIKHTKIRVIETKLSASDLLLGADFFLAHRVFVAKSQEKVYFTYNGGPVFSLVATSGDSSPAQAAPAPPSAQPAEPSDAAGFDLRGEAFASRRDFAHALPDLDRAVALAPTDADYVYHRAAARLEAGQTFLAMADIEQTLKLRPHDAPALLLRARLRFGAHDPNGGLADLGEIDKFLPAAADARLQVAALYDRQGRYDEAIKQFDLWIPAHPDDFRHAGAINGRCWARALLNQDLDKALADCDAAHRFDPKVASYLDSRGLVHLRMGHLDKAIADYDAALAIDPKLAWSLYGRGLAKLKSGDEAGGKVDVAAATALNGSIVDKAAKWGIKP